jgi:hypothetical protein
MIARWDVLLLAAAVAGGSMLIENSRRLDTGAPNEEAEASVSACQTAVMAYRADRRDGSTFDDDGDWQALVNAAETSSRCAD